MRIYVGGISFSADSETLRHLFADVGSVTDATVILDRHTHQSRGFGFIRMPDFAEARAAIARFDGKIIDGRQMYMAEAALRRHRNGGVAEEDDDEFYSIGASFQLDARRFGHVGRY